MAGMQMPNQDPDSWRTPQFRQKIIKSIEDAMMSSGSHLSQIKSPTDMENQVFQKAKSRDEYLGLIAKLIIYVRETNAKKQGGMPGQPGGPVGGVMPGMGGPPHMGMPVQTGGQSGVLQDPINALTNLTKQGMGPNMGGPQGQMAPGVQGMMGGGGHPGMGPQRPPFQTYHGPGSMGQPGVPRSMPPGSNMQGMRPDYMGIQGQGQGMGNMQGGPQVMSVPPNQMGMPPNVSQGMGQQQSMGPSLAPAHSPAMLPSPSGGVIGITPSPASRTQMQSGAPSPSANLNTPGNANNPPSVGSDPSPAGRNPEEERMYLEKLKQLQKYVEPLKRMITKIEKDDDRKKDLQKMKNLLEILTDSTKRLAFETLSKCQQVLEKLDLEFQKADTTGKIPTVPHMALCQSLLDKVASQAKTPLFNHTLKRTFGPALEALHGTPIRPPSPPAKKPKVQTSPKNGVSDLLQGEIARLNQRFFVDLDPLYHMESKDVHLICKLEDKNLPSVPPISVTIPESYPKTSPSCDTCLPQYESTPFLQKIQKSLSSHLVNMPSQFSLTALLNLWEMSVRKASVSTASPIRV